MEDYLEENVTTFEDIGDAIGTLIHHIRRLSKTEYTGHDKELLEQCIYEMEKAKNVVD